AVAFNHPPQVRKPHAEVVRRLEDLTLAPQRTIQRSGGSRHELHQTECSPGSSRSYLEDAFNANHPEGELRVHPGLKSSLHDGHGELWSDPIAPGKGSRERLTARRGEGVPPLACGKLSRREIKARYVA